jgi:hypothetical protein
MKKTAKATLGEYHDYVSWTYTPKPKTAEERRVNRNLLALFGKIGQMAVDLMRRK